MAPPPRRRVRFRILVEDPPRTSDLAFGLQDKGGALRAGVPQRDGALAFDGAAEAVAMADGAVRLRGSIVHGPAAAPFLYLSARPAGDAGGPWRFRMKIPLPELDALPDEPAVYQVRIRATGGGTVPMPPGGWRRGAVTE
ncbi:MAG TPA: DUF5990 family protein [Candidatus Limnocylindrales bacterium]|nr:DUF5990 family protein [Candidatus Limnocylindrales bacterium]